MKALLPLTAVTHFVKLWAAYATNSKCRQPAIRASLMALHHMGKGPYFAQKIWELESYLLKHQALPPSKPRAHHQQLTLLDNESVLQGL